MQLRVFQETVSEERWLNTSASAARSTGTRLSASLAA
jgi:hypothetical protein